MSVFALLAPFYAGILAAKVAAGGVGTFLFVLFFFLFLCVVMVNRGGMVAFCFSTRYGKDLIK
jgi:hypothetical protein